MELAESRVALGLQSTLAEKLGTLCSVLYSSPVTLYITLPVCNVTAFTLKFVSSVLWLFLQHLHDRDSFLTNWGPLGLLATVSMGESPLKLTCIIACTRVFHSTGLKLQKQRLTVIFIALVNFRKVG